MQRKSGLSIAILLLFSLFSFSQKADSIKTISHFGGTITATQNGISLIPSFSLGRPALMFDLNLGGKKLTFEPFFRFGTDAKPWSFIFWGRYKLVTGKEFKMSIGAHPAFVFRTVTDTLNGIATDVVQTNRYVAADITPTYFISKSISLGIYYLYSHGLGKTAVQNTHFLTFSSNFSDIKIARGFFIKYNPQIYYLNQDGKEGFYYTQSLSLGMKNYPLSVQTILNKVLHTGIPGSDFVWNVSLIYSFNKNYVRHQ